MWPVEDPPTAIVDAGPRPRAKTIHLSPQPPIESVTSPRTSVVGVTDESPDPTTPSDDAVRDVPEPSRPDGSDVDLDAVERDLAAVEVALARLSDGTYWTDEVTGEPIPEPVLAADPTARRA